MRLKIRFFLLFVVLLGGHLYGQQINIDVKEKKLSTVLEELADQYQLRISFDAGELSRHTVSIKATNEPIEAFLERLLAPYHLMAKRNKKNFFYIKSTQRELVFLLSDEKSKGPVPYANVNIKNSFKGNISNDKGVVSLTFDQRDTAILIGAFGYRTIEFNPAKENGDTVRLSLGVTAVDLETVTVLEYINRGIRLVGDISSPTLLLADMEVLPGLPEADVLLSAQMLPGFESNNETASGINVRGSDQSQTLLYWERIPVYKPAHYFGQITSIIPSMTKKVEAYKNYIPSSFLGATSGLLNMRAEDSLAKQTSWTSNTTFTHSELSIQTPVREKLSVQLGGRFSYNHFINTPLFTAYTDKLFDGVREIENDDEEQVDVESELRFWDINAKVIYEPNANNYWSLSAISNNDQFNFNGNDSTEGVETIQDHLESFRGFNSFYEHRFNSKWKANLSFSTTDYDAEDNSTEWFRDEEGSEFDSSFISNELNSLEAKTTLVYNGWEKHVLAFGYQLHYYETALSYTESNSFEAPIRELRNSIEVANGIFGKAELAILPNLLVRPQLRVDYFSREEQLTINPILNTQLKLGKGFWLKSSMGSYAQALSSINDATLSASNVTSGIWVLAGEDDTEVLRSRHGSLGLLYQEKGWIVDIDFYTKKVDGVTALNLFEENVSETLDFELGESTSSGVDLMVKKNFGRYHSWLSYTYSETNNTFEGIESNTFASSLDRPHQFRWTHTYIINQFEFSLGWTYKSGAPFTQARAINFDEDDEEYTIQYDATNAVRLPVYHRMDFSFWYRFPAVTKEWNGLLGISVINLYNRDNVWKRFYRLEDLDDDDVPEIEREERFFLGLTPNVTLKLNF